MTLEPKILGSVHLGPQRSLSKIWHTINGRDVRDFARLELATYEGQEGYYLLYTCADGLGTDTWHRNLRDAMHQAEFEFEIRPDEWQIAN